MADDIPLTKRSVQVESKEVNQNDWNEQTFFPFQEDRERHQARIDQHAASFPKLGIGALIGALALIALSGGILLIIQGPGMVVSDWTVHVYKTHRYVTIPKPAAWLSGILSGISVCFHIALSEGLNIAWWYHVRQENATVRDLHDIWGHGTSTWTVVKSGAKDVKNGIVGLSRKATNRHHQDQPYSQRKHFSYVALATLFVATIPLNGFLLQNAVVVVPATAQRNATVKIPILNADNFVNLNGQYAVSATGGADGGGGVSDWSQMLGKLSQTVNTKTTAIADLGSFNTTCLGNCKANVTGVGFQVNCNEAKQSYDIPTSACGGEASTAMTRMWNVGTDVFSVAVTYDTNASRNRVTVNTLWKDSKACTGSYSMQTCHLDLASVVYPVVINSGIKEATVYGLKNATIMSLDMDLTKDSPFVETLEPVPEYYSLTTTVAGLAGFFGQTLNSTVSLHYNNNTNAGCFDVEAQGIFGQQQLSAQSTFQDTDVADSFDICTGRFENATTQTLASIHSMMFQLGAYNWLTSYGDPKADPNFDLTSMVAENTPHPMAVQSYQQNQYRIVWAWYFGAMSVTLLVAAFITPTFWGYWRLERKTTMSPFETARAFHAPILYQEDSTIKSEDLIKRVGDVQIHRDLPVVPLSQPSGSRPGTEHTTSTQVG